jgi:hypothetical protein
MWLTKKLLVCGLVGEAGKLTVIWIDGDEDDTTKARSEIAIPLAATTVPNSTSLTPTLRTLFPEPEGICHEIRAEIYFELRT